MLGSAGGVGITGIGNGAGNARSTSLSIEELYRLTGWSEQVYYSVYFLCLLVYALPAVFGSFLAFVFDHSFSVAWFRWFDGNTVTA